MCLITNISATELPNFIRKYYLLHELLISKYWRQNISVSNIASHTAVMQALRRPAHRARKTMHYETPDFITPALWPANSPDLNPVDYQILWKLQDRVYRSQLRDVDVSLAWSKSGNISTRWSSIKQSGSGIHVLELAFDFEHTVDILNTDFRCDEVLPFARMHTWQSITRVPIVDTYAFEWPY